MKKEDKKLKEAELLNQQTPVEEVPAPQPAAPEEVAAAQQEVVAPVEQPVEEMQPEVEEPTVEVDGDEVEIPATVEIKTQDLSQAIAMATGDVEPAELGVDVAAEKAEQQAEEPLVQEPEVPAVEEQPMTEAVTDASEAAEAAKPEGNRKVSNPESEPTGVSKEDYKLKKAHNKPVSLKGEDPFKESLTEEEKQLILEYRKYKEAAEDAPAAADNERPAAECSNEVIGVVEAPKAEDIAAVDNAECEACAAAESAAPMEEAAEPEGKTADGAINAEGYQDEKLDEAKNHRYVIYCEDPDKSAFSGMTGYVGNDSNWGSIEALVEHDPEAVFDSREAAQELIDTDPSFELHKEEGVKYTVVDIDEDAKEAPESDGWKDLKAWIDEVTKMAADEDMPVSEFIGGNALKVYKALRPIIAMKNKQRLEDMYYNMYDELSDLGITQGDLIGCIEDLLGKQLEESCKMKEANVDEEVMMEDPIMDTPVEQAPMVDDIPAFGADEDLEASEIDDMPAEDIDSFVSDDDIDIADYDPNEAAGIDAMLQTVEDDAVATMDVARDEVRDTADKLQGSVDFLKTLVGDTVEEAAAVEEEPVLEECVERIPVQLPKKSIKESIEEEPLVIEEDAESIIYPAGSEPEADIPAEEENLVQTYEARVRAKREAIAQFRESIKRKNEAESERFNEALKSSVKVVESQTTETNPNSWASQKFVEKYEERQKLNFKELRQLLNNGFLG